MARGAKRGSKEIIAAQPGHTQGLGFRVKGLGHKRL